MKQIKKKSTASSVFNVIMVVGVIVVVTLFLAYTVNVTKNGAGTTVSKASRPMTLTAGDDVLSLEQDLRILNRDETSAEESRMISEE